MSSPGAIPERQLTLVRYMAGEEADRYISEVWLPSLRNASGLPVASLHDLREAFSDAAMGLRCIYGQYAFARRGKDRAELGEIAIESLARSMGADGVRSLLSK